MVCLLFLLRFKRFETRRPIITLLVCIMCCGLSSLLQTAEKRKMIKGAKVCSRAPFVTLLFFDILLFCQTTRSQNEYLKKLIQEHGLASG